MLYNLALVSGIQGVSVVTIYTVTTTEYRAELPAAAH